MPCFDPLYAVQTSPGAKLRFLSKSDFENLDDFKIAQEFCLQEGHELFRVPCNKCLGCQLESSKQWAVRCALEAQEYEHNYFLTLTYEKSPLAFKSEVDLLTGEFLDYKVVGGTLLKSDFQKFFKRLRIDFKRQFGFEGIRFFGCGEYGSSKGRPHYHALVFNLPLNDLIFYRYSDSGFPIYLSPILTKIWGLGHVFVSEFSYRTAAYVSRYVMKKFDHFDPSDSDDDLEPEFRTMSRRPGLAAAYFERNKDRIYEFDKVYVQQDDSPLVSVPPKYFDYLLEKEFPDLLSEVKEVRRSKADILSESEMAATDLSYSDYLDVKLLNLEQRISKLKRGDISDF